MIDVESVTFGHGARVSISIPEPKCLTVLDALIKATHADFGNVQLFNTENGSLEIVAQRGFSGEFLEYFSSVHENQAACGTAMGSGMPVLVDDVLTSSIFAENGLQKVMANAHVRAVYSTPLIRRDRSILGMASIHFRAAQRPSADELRIADALARQLSARVEDFSRRPQPSKVARKIVSPSTRRLRSRALRLSSGPGQEAFNGGPVRARHVVTAFESLPTEIRSFIDAEVCEDSSLVAQVNAAGFSCERCNGDENIVAVVRLADLSTTLGICGNCYRELSRLSLGDVI